MKYEKIKQTINEWDPIDLLSHAPKDEYDLEIQKIAELYYDSITVETYGEAIYDVFSMSFGHDTFCKGIDDCIYIAKKILR